VQEPGAAATPSHSSRRPAQPAARPRAAARPRRAPAAPVVQGMRRVRGQRLGAYETRYDVRHGYATDRTIIRP
jgi:hypothetical protein